MKLALLGDVHIGARNDNIAFHDHYEKFYRDIFFPYLDEHNITVVHQFGDLFDRRKYINFYSLWRSRQYLFDELKKRNITMYVPVGNHDTYYKNTNDVNSPELLLGEYDNIIVWSEPTTVEHGSMRIALLPWVCSGNYEQSVKFIMDTNAHALFGHLELAGFEMHRGSIIDHGTLDTKLFDKFDMVCSGHYHHRSSRGNINYLGTPYELTWVDYDDPRGFHIFDTETRELQFIRNPYRMFNKIHYDDQDKEMSDIVDVDLSDYRGTFVKVVVRNKTNPFWFDMLINKLEKVGVVDLQVVEDHLNLNLEDDADIIDEAEDTLTILRKVVDGIDINVPKKELDKFLSSLYNEALHAE